MEIYNQKKKEIVYKKLQKILNLSLISQQFKTSRIYFENTNIDGEKTSLNNILQEIFRDHQIANSKDQSRCVSHLRDFLVKFYGQSSGLSMKQIDKLYNFSKKNQLSLHKPKKKSTPNPYKKLAKQQSKQKKKKIMLQSTNSTNSHVQLCGLIPMSYNRTPIHKQLYKKFDSKTSLMKELENSQINIRKNSNGVCKTPKNNHYNKFVFQNQQQKPPKKKILRRKSCQYIPAQRWKTQISQKQQQLNKQSSKQILKKMLKPNEKKKKKNLRKSQQINEINIKNIEGCMTSPSRDKYSQNSSRKISNDHSKKKFIHHFNQCYRYITQGINDQQIKKTIKNFKIKVQKSIKEIQNKQEIKQKKLKLKKKKNFSKSKFKTICQGKK